MHVRVWSVSPSLDMGTLHLDGFAQRSPFLLCLGSLLLYRRACVYLFFSIWRPLLQAVGSDVVQAKQTTETEGIYICNHQDKKNEVKVKGRRVVFSAPSCW